MFKHLRNSCGSSVVVHCCLFFGVRVPVTCVHIIQLGIFRFGFEGWFWVLIASVPGICILFFTFIPRLYTLHGIPIGQ